MPSWPSGCWANGCTRSWCATAPPSPRSRPGTPSEQPGAIVLLPVDRSRPSGRPATARSRDRLYAQGPADGWVRSLLSRLRGARADRPGAPPSQRRRAPCRRAQSLRPAPSSRRAGEPRPATSSEAQSRAAPRRTWLWAPRSPGWPKSEIAAGSRRPRRRSRPRSGAQGGRRPGGRHPRRRPP